VSALHTPPALRGQEKTTPRVTFPMWVDGGMVDFPVAPWPFDETPMYNRPPWKPQITDFLGLSPDAAKLVDRWIAYVKAFDTRMH
jgi:hypothetical protein